MTHHRHPRVILTGACSIERVDESLHDAVDEVDEDDEDDSWGEDDWDDDEDAYDPADHEDRVAEIDALERDGRTRAVRARPGHPGPLENAWLLRVGDCGSDSARVHRGREYLQGGHVEALGVDTNCLYARVLGSYRYRVDVTFSPTPEALTARVMRRYAEALASSNTGEHDPEAFQEAVLAVGPELFPTWREMETECTCPDSYGCKHIVAVVHGFGAAIGEDPLLLCSLWGLSPPAPRRRKAAVVAPLADDRVAVKSDLGALFGSRTRPVPPCEQPEASREYLRVLGLTNRKIDAWIREGVLRETARADVFARTPEVNRRIDELLAR